MLLVKGMKIKILLTFVLVSLTSIVCAQRVVVSTDAVKWGTVSPNLSVDLVVSSRLSLNVEGVYDPLVNVNFKRLSLSTELRYWFKRPFYSHYLGVNAVTSTYEFEKQNKKEQMVAIGVGYGYSIILSKRMSLTPHVGIGAGFVRSHANNELYTPAPIQTEFRPLLTKFGVSLSYIIN